MNANPHIGPSGLKPGEFGYEFDCSLADCTYRYHSLSIKDFHPGVLEIVPPAGKVAHLQIGNLIEASTAMLAALREVTDSDVSDARDLARTLLDSKDRQLTGTQAERVASLLLSLARNQKVARAAIAKAEGR